jgi:hypothetical protein
MKRTLTSTAPSADPPGAAVERLVQRASSIVIVAPFIKVPALRRILAAAPRDCEVLCITRWKPDEVARGVSDLEVLDVLEERGRSELLLVSNLHAKLYGADGVWLVGSANVTLRGLGWCPGANVEILVSPTGGDPGVGNCLAHLRASAVRADRVRQADVRSAAAELGDALPLWASPAGPEENAESVYTGGWEPACKKPESVFSIYCGHDSRAGLISRVVLEDAQRDLACIGPASGLDLGAFRAVVRAALSQSVIVQAFTDAVAEAPEGAAVHAVAEALEPFVGADECVYANSREAYEVLKEWLRVFFPDRYVFSGSAMGDLICLGSVPGEWSPRKPAGRS